MISGFDFATAGQIVFGRGALARAGEIAAPLGRRALVVTGRDPARAIRLEALLRQAGLDTCVFNVSGEPSVDTAAAGVELARARGCDLVVGCGGGSALDTGKAIAALMSNGGEPLDYLEVVGRGRALERASAPFIAIPTTAGTGAEVTRNAVLAVPQERVKVSLRSPHMLPRVALVDPELTLSAPPDVTAATGLDALTQVLEPFVCRRPSPLTDALCREGLRRAARALRRACVDGQDLEAREDMALASLCGGLALANAQLGAVHGFAGPLGGLLGAPHGALCARLLPGVMAANIAALQATAASADTLARYQEIARLLTGDPSAHASDGVTWVEALCRELEIPGLARHGLTPALIPAAVDQAQRASSMKGNPVVLPREQLAAILTAAR